MISFVKRNSFFKLNFASAGVSGESLMNLPVCLVLRVVP